MNTEPTTPPSSLGAASCYASSCGRVTLYHGDSESMPRIEADALVSDPPYGHGYKSNGCAMVERGGWKPTRGERPMVWDGGRWTPIPSEKFPPFPAPTC